MRIPHPETAAWLDGRRLPAGEIRLPIDDPACHAGLGLFETLAVRDGRALDVEPHLDRLAVGAAKLGLERIDRDELVSTIESASAGAPSSRAWLKLILTRGGRRLVLLGEVDPAEEGRSVSAILLPWRRNPADPLDGVKSLSYAANVLGLEEARRRGADEGVWLNTAGHLAEGCTSNLFVVQGRKLFTAGTRDGILPGVVRGLAIRAARDLDIAVHEGKVRLARLEHAAEAFLTSSLTGIRPLVRFEGRPVGRGGQGRITEDVAQRVERMRDPSTAR